MWCVLWRKWVVVDKYFVFLTFSSYNNFNDRICFQCRTFKFVLHIYLYTHSYMFAQYTKTNIPDALVLLHPRAHFNRIKIHKHTQCSLLVACGGGEWNSHNYLFHSHLRVRWWRPAARWPSSINIFPIELRIRGGIIFVDFIDIYLIKFR